MKQLIFSIFIFTSITIFAQPPNYDATCEEGKLKAIEDARLGKYYLLAYRLLIEKPSQADKRDFRYDYLKKNFNINTGLGGCVVSEGSECYGNKMYDLIIENFGNNFFDSINPIIDSLYKIDLEERIISNFVFNSYDSMPGIIGGEKFLIESISQIIHPDSIHAVTGNVSISAIVLKDGSLDKVEVVRGISEYYDTICLRTILGIKSWKPAILNGQNVASRVIIPINFVK